MTLKYDPTADAIYIRFAEAPVKGTRAVPRNRSGAAVDFGESGKVVGVEFLAVGSGVDIQGVPNAEQIKELLTSRGFAIQSDPLEDTERVERFLNVIVNGFMGHDLYVAIEGKANFLAALGLLDYTEILGGLVLGDVNASGERKFEAFLPYLGSCYQDINEQLKERKGKKKGKGLYSFRSSLMHCYGLKSAGVIRMGIDREGRCGIEFDETKGWDYCVQQYFNDFKSAIGKLRQKLREDPSLVRNFVSALGSALDI